MPEILDGILHYRGKLLFSHVIYYPIGGKIVMWPTSRPSNQVALSIAHASALALPRNIPVVSLNASSFLLAR